MLDGFILAVWIVYVVDLFVAAVPGAWTFRGRRGAMRAAAGPDLQLAGGFALVRLPLAPWHPAFVAGGAALPDAVRTARVDAVFAAARPVAIASCALAAVLLAGLPAVRVGWLTPKAWLIAGALSWAAAIVAFARAWRRIHGRRVPTDLWVATLLSPVGASRSVAAVCWRSLEALHPVEAAAALCDHAELLRVARLWAFDHPEDRTAVGRLLEPRGLADRLAAPPPEDADRSPQYCPRCGHGYAAFAQACADCGVPLAARDAAVS